MAYSTSNPPRLVNPSFTNVSGEVGMWDYSSTDAATLARVSGYITNAKALGMKAGDLVRVTDTDASPVIVTLHRVVAINTNGSADLTDANNFIVGTNTD
ncbi:MAG: hypothetical protein EB117_09260 [Betaproteobacteria bacterium]|nr:hypothetical protein [Betaproteobacteria bacterium]